MVFHPVQQLPLRLAALAVLVFVSVASAAAQSASYPWRISSPPTGEYLVRVDSSIKRGGQSSLRIEGLTSTPLGGVSVLQQLRADRYRGQRVRVSAYMRAQDVRGAGGTIALSVSGNGAVLAQGNSEQSALRGTADWQRVSAEVDVLPPAAGLNIALSLNGVGTIWLDELMLEAIGSATSALPQLPPALPAQVKALNDYYAAQPDSGRAFDFEGITLPATVGRSPLQPAGALSARGLDNLAAFARLVGVVRHFHPAEAVRITNWDDFTIRGVRAVERAPNADSLAGTLRALFASVAPDVAIYSSGSGAPAQKAAALPSSGSQGVAHWVNTGITMMPPDPARPSLYSSTLAVARTGADGQLPEGVPHPDPAWSAALGGGVSARVPVASWVVLSPGDSLPRRPVQPSAVREAASPNDRATRLAGVIAVWNVFQHSYPYFDVVKVDWPAELRRALNSAATSTTPAEYQATLRGMVAAIQDGHGNVNALAAGPRRQFIPVALDWVEGRLVVTQVGAQGSNGLQRGDVIEQINRVPVETVLAHRERTISGATPQWRRYRSVNELHFDSAGAAVTLRVRSAGASAARDVQLTYSHTRVTEPLPDKISEPKPGIFYVDISRITDADFTAALPRLQQARGIVFDLRGYPNQVSTPAILARLASDTIRSAHFETPTFRRPDRAAVQWRDGNWVLPPLQPHLGGRIAFLTGGGAISYAESTMGIVEYYKLGEVVGATTAGTNGNINIVPATGGYQVIFTGMRVRKRDDSPHHGVGIKPTIPVLRTLKGVAEGRDEVLERGIAAVETVRADRP